jgi:hypothetical protein
MPPTGRCAGDDAGSPLGACVRARQRQAVPLALARRRCCRWRWAARRFGSQLAWEAFRRSSSRRSLRSDSRP